MAAHVCAVSRVNDLCDYERWLEAAMYLCGLAARLINAPHTFIQLAMFRKLERQFEHLSVITTEVEFQSRFCIYSKKSVMCRQPPAVSPLRKNVVNV
jgi:hypothetical protein